MGNQSELLTALLQMMKINKHKPKQDVTHFKILFTFHTVVK